MICPCENYNTHVYAKNSGLGKWQEKKRERDRDRDRENFHSFTLYPEDLGLGRHCIL